LTDKLEAFYAFPGGWQRREWLNKRLANILGRDRKSAPKGAASPPTGRTAVKPSSKTAPEPAPKAAAKAAPKAAPKVPAKPALKVVQAASTTPPSSQRLPPAAAAEAALPALPRIEIDIPVAAEFDLAPLENAAAGEAPPEIDGAWFRLRERFAHLGLTQGFDELLCLPHLHSIETFWYQVETVRKVLKQFRGRVLLADEVGLGKTIEAGMVLKEYLLRGMVESVLVLTPASLVGQWREELLTKFDIACASTHDALLRGDPERFWGQKRVIASIALARRGEHAQRLLARSFDLVIVDEAHHLRDRTSASYKLVDGINKRFLLLLSATPVQNDLTELYNLLTLLKPGIFKTLKEFKSAYMTAGKPRQPANPERLRELMRGAMIRNTRAVVALKLPRRHAVTIRVDGVEGEREAYLDLAAAARPLAAGGHPGRLRLSLRHLLAAAGSSPAAGAGAAIRFAAGHPGDPGWQALAQRWAALAAGGKEAALINLLRRNPDEKKLVFVHYRETLDHLAGLLARHRAAQRPRQGRRHRRVPRPGTGAAEHRIRRRGAQYPVLQHTDQFRRAVESHGDRAAHRPHRPHRPRARGVRVQPGDARHPGGAGTVSAGREDLDVRAGGRRGGRHSWRHRGGPRLRRPGARRLAADDGGDARRSVRHPWPAPR
jgi:SNF2-related domain